MLKIFCVRTGWNPFEKVRKLLCLKLSRMYFPHPFLKNPKIPIHQKYPKYPIQHYYGIPIFCLGFLNTPHIHSAAIRVVPIPNFHDTGCSTIIDRFCQYNYSLSFCLIMSCNSISFVTHSQLLIQTCQCAVLLWDL